MSACPIALKIVVSRDGFIRINLLAREATRQQQSAMLLALRSLDAELQDRRRRMGTTDALAWLQSAGVEFLERCGFNVSVERHGRWPRSAEALPSAGRLH